MSLCHTAFVLDDVIATELQEFLHGWLEFFVHHLVVRPQHSKSTRHRSITDITSVLQALNDDLVHGAIQQIQGREIKFNVWFCSW